MWSRKEILVITGGSGFLGSKIAKLAYDHWDELQEIRLFDQRPPDRTTITEITGFTPPSRKPKVSFYYGDILNEESLLGAFAKADVVIHSAAVVETGSILARRKMKRVNIDGTNNVVQACLECGVRALVFTGSLAQVLTRIKGTVNYDETYRIPGNSELIFPQYGESKIEAENLVLLANDQEGENGVKLKTCSLRFPGLYGEGDSFMSLNVKTARRFCGYFVPVGLVPNSGVTMQVIYVGNGAWAHIVAARKLLDEGEASENLMSDVSPNGAPQGSSDASLDSTTVGGNFYYIGDHTPITTLPKLYGQFLHPLGCRVLPFGVPFFLMRIFTFLLEFLLIILALVRIDIHSPLTRSSLKYLEVNHSFSWKKAKKELGYQPLFSYKTSLARSVAHFRQN